MNVDWMNNFRFSEELAILGLIVIAVWLNEKDIALAIAGGLIGYLRGTSKSNGTGG